MKKKSGKKKSAKQAALPYMVKVLLEHQDEEKRARGIGREVVDYFVTAYSAADATEQALVRARGNSKDVVTAQEVWPASDYEIEQHKKRRG